MNRAVRAARAMIEIIGFTPGAVGKRLPSPIHRFRTSCDSPVGFAADVRGSVPALAEPIGWAENKATPFSRMPRRPMRSMKASNSAPRIGSLPSPTEHSRRCRDPMRRAPAARRIRAASCNPWVRFRRSREERWDWRSGWPRASIVTRPSATSRTRTIVDAARSSRRIASLWARPPDHGIASADNPGWPGALSNKGPWWPSSDPWNRCTTIVCVGPLHIRIGAANSPNRAVVGSRRSPRPTPEDRIPDRNRSAGVWIALPAATTVRARTCTGMLMGTVAERGFDAPDFAALDDEMIRFRVEQEPGPGAVRVREIRHEGGLLRIVDAAEETEVTATAAAVRVPGDDVVIDAEPVPEGRAPAAQHIVRGIHDALRDVHVEAAPHRVAERIECGRGHPGHAGLPFPLDRKSTRLNSSH